MSYVVLARKWRPNKFEDVVAQEHVTKTLKNAIVNERLASAYLFSGTRGVGKTTIARIFAKAINCQEGPTPTPCNKCSSCLEITQSRSLDVFEIDGASNRGIDEVRNLRANLKYAASKGKHKIYIIDEVHMLTTEAFNALLKTLEEPPARVLFMFATTEPHKIPVTILSRCQRYDFQRIPLNMIIAKLRDICSAEKIKIEEQALNLIAKKSEGSLRDSQSLLDQVVSFCGQNVKLKDLSDLLGIIDQEIYFECSEIIAKRDVPAGLLLVEKIFNQGFDNAEFLIGLAEHFRNILVVAATNQVKLLEGLENYSDKYQKEAQLFSETDLLRFIQIASDSAYQVKRSSNPKLILEFTIVKMIKMDKSVELQTILSNIDNLKKTSDTPDKSSSNATEASDSSASTVAANTKQIKTITKEEDREKKIEPLKINDAPVTEESLAVSLEKIKSDWPKIVDEVKNKKIHLGSFLNEGFPTALKNKMLEVSQLVKNLIP